jgi:hypothetical protein
VIADIPILSNCDAIIDYDSTQYNPNSNLMPVPPVNVIPLHPLMVDSPFCNINIITPEDRVDIFQGLSTSSDLNLTMTRTNPPKQLSDVLANRLQFAVDVL